MRFGLELREGAPRLSLERALRVLSALRWPVICWVIVFWRLGYPSLLDPDEAHYAELTREMVRARSWLVPLLDGAPYIDKPVLFHWLQGLFVHTFGESEIALRLPTALAAIGLFGITRWVGTRLFDATVGDWGATMFATIPATFLLASVGVFDMLFAAFLFGGVSCLLVAAIDKRDRLQHAGWILLTLAVMTKGPVALVLVALFFLAATVASAQTRRAVRAIRWPAGLACVTMAASPWFMWMWGRFGDEFIRGYVLAGNLWYLTAPLSFSGRQSSYAFYFRTFSAAFFPWSLVMIGYGMDTVATWRRREGLPAGELLLWIWVFVVIAMFTVAGFKLDTYIFPAAPACCLLAARAWQRAMKEESQRWTRLSVILMAVLLVGGGITGGIALFQINLDLDWTASGLPIALGVGGTALLWLMWRGGWWPPNPLHAPLITLLAVYAALVIVGFPVLERSRPTAPIGRWIQRQAVMNPRVGTYGVADWRASIRYYTDRPVSELRTTDDVRSFIEAAPYSYVLMLRRDYRALRERGLDVKVVYGRPVIAGRSGKFIRRQLWDELVIVADGSAALADGSP